MLETMLLPTEPGDDLIYLGPAFDSTMFEVSLSDHFTVDEEGRRFVPMRYGYKHGKAIGKAIERMGRSEPDWFRSWQEESAWANRIRWSSGTTPRIMWSFGSILVIQSPYIHTLAAALFELNGDVFWSDTIEGWVFPDFDTDLHADQLRELSIKYNFDLSVQAQSLIEGSSESGSLLEESAAAALESGYAIPEVWGSEFSLMEHQRVGVLNVLDRRRVILADAPGLGKGSIFVSSVLAEFEREIRLQLEVPDGEPVDVESEEAREIMAGLGPVVLICQVSLVLTLAAEIHKWWPGANIALVKGTAPDEIPQSDFIVCPISVVGKRMDDILEREPGMLIVDESHMLKNGSSQRTQAVRQISDYINEYGDALAEAGERDTTLIILTSGTPILNRPNELWSQLEVLGEDAMFADMALEAIGDRKIKFPIHSKGSVRWSYRDMSDRELFGRRWCGGGFGQIPFAGGKKGWAWLDGGASHVAELNRLLSETVMIRRRKREVFSYLPDPYESVVPTPLSERDMEEYRDMRNDFRDYMLDIVDEYAEKWKVSAEEATRRLKWNLDFAEPLIRMAKLMQFVSHRKVGPVIDWVERFMEADPDVVERDAPLRRKLIIFAHHIETQKALVESEALQKYGLVTILRGEKNIPESVERFQQDEGVRIIVCYSGAREGHTLTAARDVLVVDPPDVPSHAEQMVCRCYARVSTDYEPHEAWIHFAVTPGTVEVLRLRRMSLKKGVSSAVIDGIDDPNLRDKKEQEKLTADERLAEAELILEMVLQGDDSVRIAT